MKPEANVVSLDEHRDAVSNRAAAVLDEWERARSCGFVCGVDAGILSAGLSAHTAALRLALAMKRAGAVTDSDLPFKVGALAGKLFVFGLAVIVAPFALAHALTVIVRALFGGKNHGD